jgi:hypothetical protein
MVVELLLKNANRGGMGIQTSASGPCPGRREHSKKRVSTAYAQKRGLTLIAERDALELIDTAGHPTWV